LEKFLSSFNSMKLFILFLDKVNFARLFFGNFALIFRLFTAEFSLLILPSYFLVFGKGCKACASIKKIEIYFFVYGCVSIGLLCL